MNECARAMAWKASFSEFLCRWVSSPGCDVVAQGFATPGLLQLIVQPHESEEFEGFLQFAKQSGVFMPT
jgi:hypothetical protein